ncbi:uncharacterized protein (TIGR00288 family) [Pararhizobium capsulatum DSM 1112]|uniref:Uncharacterized protein (TIGR00288 family) n=1 Tax=Pararhizobium capsulatum DSM 1112 TaxID=1121113 RepID=A0ABU0BRL1_9HYPH|nr:NYN domain-containing protein [Pararhizobium capsulatum]MDQ0320567.1 uncharacterized protein (TIGR00288 family) [Pararhizobium capsulatum DSM 1112]
MQAQAKVAVLVDAENISGQMAAEIFRHAEMLGKVVERRVYGDFSNGSLKPWIAAAPSLALDLRQTPNPVNGKNAADLLLAIDASELLYLEDIDVFCLATSDSDFTTLAMRIRARGKKVIGIGENKADSSYRGAFDKFVPLSSKNRKSGVEGKGAIMRDNEKSNPQIAALRSIVAVAVGASNPADDGWVGLSLLGTALRRLNPGFSPKAYGSAQLTKLLASLSFVETRNHASNGAQMRLRPSEETGVVVLRERLARA